MQRESLILNKIKQISNSPRQHKDVLEELKKSQKKVLDNKKVVSGVQDLDKLTE